MKPPARNHLKNLQAFERLCRERGVPLTIQRRTIYQTLLTHPDHPTVDDVYGAVRGRLPGVSRATVYRVLETLVHLGVITKTSHPGSVARYDKGTHRHHHLVCVRCEQAADLNDPALDAVKLPNTRRLGFQIADYSIYFTGLCRACRKNGTPRSRKRRGRRIPR